MEDETKRQVVQIKDMSREVRRDLFRTALRTQVSRTASLEERKLAHVIGVECCMQSILDDTFDMIDKKRQS